MQIVATEIPYQVNKAELQKKIADLVHEKVIEGISDIRDESDRDGVRVVIELKKGEVPDVVLNNLFKHTQFQTTFGVITLAIVSGRPRVLPLVDLLDHFVEFRRDVVRRRIEFELKKAEARAHILEGLAIALDRSRRRDRPDPRLGEPGPGARRPDGAVRPDADPGAGDPRHAAPAPDRPGAAEDPRRARGAEDRRSSGCARSSAAGGC